MSEFKIVIYKNGEKKKKIDEFYADYYIAFFVNTFTKIAIVNHHFSDLHETKRELTADDKKALAALKEDMKTAATRIIDELYLNKQSEDK